MEKELIILAKSSKHSDLCIAGIDVATGEWIRPVSNNQNHEGAVPLSDITYKDGNVLQLLDRVIVDFIKHTPTISQPENYLYDSNKYWIKTGESSINEVIKLRGYDKSTHVFYNNDRCVEEDELKGNPSLLLLKVDDIILFTDIYQKTKFNFTYNNIKYQYFSVSDKRFSAVSFSMSKLCVVFSLTGKYNRNGKYYKMVATIFR